MVPDLGRLLLEGEQGGGEAWREGGREGEKEGGRKGVRNWERERKTG